MPPYFFYHFIFFPLVAVGVGICLFNREIPYYPNSMPPYTEKIGICPKKIGSLRLFFFIRELSYLTGFVSV